MSGECDDCSWHTLECVCGLGCPCRQNDLFTHLNAVRRDSDAHPELSTQIRLNDVKWVNVRGREEHEAVIKDSGLCKELGLDQAYETFVYLKRWGSWLRQ
jgi:hypothetical protein